MGVQKCGFGLAALLACRLSAQTLGPAPPGAADGAWRSGAQIQSASVFGGYFSVAPEAGAFGGGSSLRDDFSAGGSVSLSLGWRGARTSALLSYTPSYVRRFRYTDWSSWQQVASFAVERRHSARWTSRAAASGVIGSMASLVFEPGSAAGLSAAGSAAPDAGLGATGAGLGAGAAVYGSRILSASASAATSFAMTGRLTFNMRTGVTRVQGLGSGPDGALAVSALLAHSESATAGLGLSYAVSPRTQFAVDADASRVHSRVQDSYRSQGSATLSRRLTEHLFGELRGGAGFITPVRQAAYMPHGAEYLAGGRFGYRGLAHTVSAQVERQAGDSYGLGSASSISAGLAWTWRRPASSWWVSTDGGWQRFFGQASGISAGAFDSWRGNASLGRRISRHTGVQIQYGFLYSSVARTGLADLPSQHIVRVAFVWTAADNAER